MRKIEWVALAAACLLTVPAFAESLAGPYRGEILRVIDGDTVQARIRIWLAQDLVTLVRIRGIDAPEHRGKCPEEIEKARAARDYLSALLAAGRVLVSDIRQDKYSGRVEAVLHLPTGEELAKMMLAAGPMAPGLSLPTLMLAPL